MNKTSVQIKILIAGVTQTQIARDTGLAQHTVMETLKLRGHNQVVQELVARLVDEKPEELWGDDYAPAYRKRRFKTDSSRRKKVG